MSEPTFLVIDTETGGLDPYCESLLTVSLVAWSRERVGPAIDLFVSEPDLVTTTESMGINRIDLSRIRTEGVTPSVAVDCIGQFVRQHFRSGQRVVLAGHNVAFDIGFLKRLYRLANRDYSLVFSHRSFDTSSVLRFLRLTRLADLPDDGSEAAFAHFDVQPPEGSRHSAAGDALATAHLITRLVEFGEGLVSGNAGIAEGG